MSDPVMPETAAPASDECCCQECVADGSVLPIILPLPYKEPVTAFLDRALKAQAEAVRLANFGTMTDLPMSYAPGLIAAQQRIDRELNEQLFPATSAAKIPRGIGSPDIMSAVRDIARGS